MPPLQVVSFADWQKIDKAEVERGQAKGKPRDKVRRVQRFTGVQCREVCCRAGLLPGFAFHTRCM